MLIDPKGLFYGERIGACSDEAQLHFPRLMAAANGFGRIEMSVSKLHATVYAGFSVKPTGDQLRKWFREYHANFLLYVYMTPSGAVWGQWVITKGKLPKWKTAEDRRSPAPVEEEYEAFQRSYIEAKRARYSVSNDLIAISEDFKSLPKSSEDFRRLPHGEVVGEEVGEEVILASPSAQPLPSRASKADKEPHPLFTNARIAIDLYWKAHVHPNTTPTWDGSEAKALSDLLKATPGMTLQRFRTMLENRGLSDVTQCERPRKWIPGLPSYELGPLDAFGKPKALRKATVTTLSTPRTPTASETAKTLSREDEEKRVVVDGWRELRDRGDPAYEHEAPTWVKNLLSNELDQRQVA